MHSKSLTLAIDFVIPGKAIALARPRFTRNGHAYLPKSSREYRKRVQAIMLEALNKHRKGEKFTGAVKIHIMEFRMKPKSWSKAKREAIQYPGRPDLDNIIKAILDAGNGILWLDDSQINNIQASKCYADERYGENGAKVLVRVMGQSDSEGTVG